MFGFKSFDPKAFRRYWSNSAGSVATMFALSSIPIVAAAGATIDYNRIVDTEAALQALADAASLAGAATAGDEDTMEAAANVYLTNNAVARPGVTYTTSVEADEEQIEVTITASVEGTLMSAVFNTGSGRSLGNGGDFSVVSREVDATAEYQVSNQQDVCILTLDRTAPEGLYFSGSGDFTSTDCGMHSNSNAVDGLYRGGSSDVRTDFAHVVGNYVENGNGGDFVGITPVTGKRPIDDPFDLDIDCPTTGVAAATPYSVGNGRNRVNYSTRSLSASAYTNITVGNGGTATFTSGVHYILGEIEISNGGKLEGENVTLVLCGAAAAIDHQGGDIELSAPSDPTSEYPGFAIIANDDVTIENALRGGPDTTLKGIYYTPNAGLDLRGNADFNVNSAYFPIVTKTLELSGAGAVNVGMDNSAYGYPEQPTLRTADESTVRLIQ